MPVRAAEPEASNARQRNIALALVIAGAFALAVIPEVINHLLVKHVPDTSPIQGKAYETAPAHLARWGFSAVLLGLTSLVVLMRGHPSRNIGRLLILLLAVNLPYLVGPQQPDAAALIKLVLANTFFVAIWNVGGSVAELKWIPIIVSAVGVYSIVGGLIIPEYMMYNIVSRKAIIAGWELAGPFGHSNVLGVYCGVAFALVPLIDNVRWRVLCAVTLVATITASATRTALIGVGFVMLWWLLCYFRSVFSIRVAGTALATITMVGMFIVPFLNWDPRAFTDRAYIWAASVRIWRESPLFGKGFDWFANDAQYSAEIANWAFVGTGHNIVMDTLVKTGLVGMAAVVPLFIIAIRFARSSPIVNQQIAIFGFLIGYFVIATTEAAWDLWPNVQLFPISAMIFAIIAVARDSDSDTAQDNVP